MKTDRTINLVWLYPTLMSTYSDRGNIIVLMKRMHWRNIEVNLLEVEASDTVSKIEEADLIIGGGAQDRQQEIVMRDLHKQKGKALKKMLDSGTPGLFTCGSPQLLGHFYEPAVGKRIKGLGIFDLYSICPGPDEPRCIGNIVAEITGIKIDSEIKTLVGFENHGGRTFLGKNTKPLGRVISGFGNNGQDKTEGAVYNNAIATYLHGPVLTKNVHLADYLIKTALENKYQKTVQLSQLEDTLEWETHHDIKNKIINREI